MKKGIDLKKRCPSIYNTAATTPHDVEIEGESFFPIVEQAAQKGQLSAIGETGLDYFYEHSKKDTQKKYLERYFDLATRTKLPVIFHCRDAFEDLFSMADQFYSLGPAVLHCFTGTLQEAKKVLDRGWYISFSGIITFKKSQALRDVVSYVPLERMLIETDSPYLAPQSKRGKLNEPSFIHETAEMIAQIKNCSVEQVGSTSSLNAKSFFSF